MTKHATTRVEKLEEQARARFAQRRGRCVCPFGQQDVYIVVDGMTDEEVAAIRPENRRRCPKCGGLNIVVKLDADDLRC